MNARLRMSGVWWRMCIAGVLILAITVTVFEHSSPAAAQVALLYPETCLGGWQYVDRAAGPPEVVGYQDVTYGPENSAVLSGAVTELFCSRFKGVMPPEAQYTDVSLHFSWQAGEGVSAETSQPEIVVEESVVEQSPQVAPTPAPAPVVVGEESLPEAATVESEPTDESTPTPSGQPDDGAVGGEESVPPPDLSEPVSGVWWQWGALTAHAQEVESLAAAPEVSPEVISEVVQSPEVEPVLEEAGVPAEEPAPLLGGVLTEDVVPTTTSAGEFEVVAEEEAISSSTQVVGEEGAADEPQPPLVPQDPAPHEVTYDEQPYFEIRYTVDGVAWHTAGVVPYISNDFSVPLPISILTSVPDLRYLQVALVSLERSDKTPTILLDAMWLEIAYDTVMLDPLAPPGTVAGDLVIATASNDNYTLISVLRNVSLTSLSHILAGTQPTPPSLIESEAVIVEEEPTPILTTETEDVVVGVVQDEAVFMVATSATMDQSMTEKPSSGSSTTAEAFVVDALLSEEASSSVEVSEQVINVFEDDSSTTSVNEQVSDLSTTTLVQAAPTLGEAAVRVLRETPGVILELWLQTRTGEYVRVAGDELLAREPAPFLLGNLVFWRGAGEATLWRYTSVSSSYDSKWVAPGEATTWEFLDEATTPLLISHHPEGEGWRVELVPHEQN